MRRKWFYVHSDYWRRQIEGKYLTLGIQEYAKRLAPYIKFQMIEVADEGARHPERS